MTRAYARAPRGERATAAVPKNWGDNITVTAGLTLRGIIAPMMLRGAMTSRAFEAYVEQCLVPELKTGDVVVMDNLAAHRRPAIAAMVASVGALVVYLPPYSPDFNPIEHGWSKLKSILRKAGARTLRRLMRALCVALRAITPSDSRGWFAHCGYSVP